MTQRAPIAVALDSTDLDRVQDWVAAVAPTVTTVKVGLELFLRHGRDSVHAIRRTADRAGSPVDLFLDLKVHDIPNTVAGAARAVAELDPTYLTVHAAGGQAMIEAAARALPRTRITAVTVLTSLSGADLDRIGLSGPPREAAVRLAVLAVDAGARAIVCSPQEVGAVRAAVPRSTLLITPGVRPAGAEIGDQQRIATPTTALADGSDLLVIGRPITAADDPGAAARAIAEAILADLGFPEVLR